MILYLVTLCNSVTLSVDMERQMCFWLMTALLLAVSGSALAQEEPAYFGVGGSLVLSFHVTLDERITSIQWKYNNQLLAEWVEGKVDLKYYGRFNGRTTLHRTTACLEIKDMGKADTGMYSVEINRVQTVCYNVKVARKVPTPVTSNAAQS